MIVKKRGDAGMIKTKSMSKTNKKNQENNTIAVKAMRVLLLLILILGLVACKNNESEVTAEQNVTDLESNELNNIFEKLLYMEFYACTDVVYGKRAFVKMDAEREKQMVDLLDSLALSNFSDISDKEETMIMGQSVLLRFMEGEKEYFLRVTSGNNLLYLQYTDEENNTTTFCGENEEDTFIGQLEAIQNEVLGDTEDTIDVGYLTWNDTEEPINKGVTAMVKMVLENNLSFNEEKDISDFNEDCIKITVNGIIYQIDTKTGTVIKTENGNTQAEVLEEGYLQEICNLLGIGEITS